MLNVLHDPAPAMIEEGKDKEKKEGAKKDSAKKANKASDLT